MKAILCVLLLILATSFTFAQNQNLTEKVVQWDGIPGDEQYEYVVYYGAVDDTSTGSGPVTVEMALIDSLNHKGVNVLHVDTLFVERSPKYGFFGVRARAPEPNTILGYRYSEMAVTKGVRVDTIATPKTLKVVDINQLNIILQLPDGSLLPPPAPTVNARRKK